MICQNCSLWSIHFGWLYMAWLIASMSYTNAFAVTRLWPLSRAKDAMYLKDQLVPWGLPAILKQVNTSPSTRARHRAGWAILQQEVPSDSVGKAEMGVEIQVEVSASSSLGPWALSICECLGASTFSTSADLYWDWNCSFTEGWYSFGQRVLGVYLWVIMWRLKYQVVSRYQGSGGNFLIFVVWFHLSLFFFFFSLQSWL